MTTSIKVNQKPNPYNKVTGCLFEPKYLTNRRADMVFLYSIASNRSWGVYSLFGVLATSQEKLQKKTSSGEKIFFGEHRLILK